jgi:glycosyltransferase involved in cell wall biosynthesis
VLSYRDDPSLVDAVQSVLDQSEPVELVVVNSGGGDPAERLRRAGVSVPVVNVPERLYPGGARNRGIDATTAPFVSFLAADCVAQPGWVAGRLREHRRGAVAVAATLTNASPANLPSTASYLLLHNRLVTADPSVPTALYGLSYARTLFDRYGRFSEDLRAGEDTEFNARFSADHPIVKPPDVRTAHRYPTTVAGLLRDAFRRGRLQATMLGRIEGGDGGRPRSLLVTARAGWNVPHAIRFALRRRDEDPHLLAACPLVVPGGAAYAVGALSTAIRPYAANPPPRAAS